MRNWPIFVWYGLLFAFPGWGLGVCAVSSEMSCVECCVLCLVLVGILPAVGCRSQVCCIGI